MGARAVWSLFRKSTPMMENQGGWKMASDMEAGLVHWTPAP